LYGILYRYKKRAKNKKRQPYASMPSEASSSYSSTSPTEKTRSKIKSKNT
jgi:hypothetical protein